jgi:hypothetical protein
MPEDQDVGRKLQDSARCRKGSLQCSNAFFGTSNCHLQNLNSGLNSQWFPQKFSRKDSLWSIVYCPIFYLFVCFNLKLDTLKIETTQPQTQPYEYDLPLPHHFGLTLVSQLGRIVYLTYMQGPNVADKVEIMFEIWKSHQNLKHSTTTCQKNLTQLWQEMYTFLPKNICRSAKQLVEGCAETLLF